MSSSERAVRPIIAIIMIAGLWIGSTACAIPHGSYARPAKATAEGTMVIGGGAVVPFLAAGSAKVGDDTESFTVIDEEGFTVVPVGSFDYAVSDGSYLGIDLSLLSVIGGKGSGVFIKPRYEHGFDGLERTLSLVIEGTVGRFSTGSGAVPWVSPTIGLRGSFDFGLVGLIFQQSIGSAIITFTAPGALMLDVRIPAGPVALHLFPEVRWDPTFVILGAANGVLVFVSGGLSVGVEIPST